jgi:hypothetical protein
VAAYRSILAPGFHVSQASDVVSFLVNAYLTAEFPDDVQGESMPERYRFQGIATILEGRPFPATATIGKAWAPLFRVEPVTSLTTGLGDDAILPGETYRLSSGTRAFKVAMLEQLFFQPDSDQLRERLLAIFKGS